MHVIGTIIWMLTANMNPICTLDLESQMVWCGMTQLYYINHLYTEIEQFRFSEEISASLFIHTEKRNGIIT